MAKTFFSTVARNAMLSGANGLLGLLPGAKALVYTGPQPANADAAITSQVLLGTLTLGTPAAVAAAGGVLTMNAIASAAAVAGGIAAFIRQCEADAVTNLFDTNVGPPNATPLVLNGSLAGGATSMIVQALPVPLIQGEVLWFIDSVSGILLQVTVGGTAGQVFGIGTTTVPITSQPLPINTGSQSSSGAGINNVNIQQNANFSITGYTITIPAAGT